MPVAVHTGAADGCKQAVRAGVRSLEHAYPIDNEALEMAKDAGVYVAPTMQAGSRWAHDAGKSQYWYYTGIL
jgi:imidazolonepropionase-like amidohydrolase